MEKFRTIIDIPDAPEKMNYQSRCLFMGSCFASDVGLRMQRLKFPVLINPFGTLFNPASISHNMEDLISGKEYSSSDLTFRNGMWFSFNHYTGFARRERQECLDTINRALSDAARWLRQCSHLIITFGTAWAYIQKESGRLVANCHKLPSAEFTRALLDPDEIAGRFGEMLIALRKLNPEICVIFTVSPVRHWKDGAVNNQLSKSVLLLSVHKLLDKHSYTQYFPAYEVFMDELRDYRFYATDMLHPSEQGIDYVWERFCETHLDDDSKKTVAGVEAILKAVSHRPMQADSPELIRFRENTLKKIDQLISAKPFLDFSGEIAALQV